MAVGALGNNPHTQVEQVPPLPADTQRDNQRDNQL